MKPIDTERKLVAIFAADVEGYSRLMGADEVGTLRDLIQRRAILDGLIASYRGRIANTGGDSVLAEFGSVVDAVQCAVEAQAALAGANADLPPDRHVNFRIGIHVGDVMIKGGDLFGDGVNIAARLQTLASAGGTCISGAAHDQVRKILPFAFADLGVQQVKNIEEPVRAFAVTAKGAAGVIYPAGSSSARADNNKPLQLPDKPSILPLWARRTRSLDALLPVLYLRGISTGDFQEALGALLGKDAPNLSPTVISRLTAEWQSEYAHWQKRDLSARRYLYVWADGVFLQARMEDHSECMLVLIGATPEGKKELIGFQVGVRESAQSWRELLIDVKRRGLKITPEIAVGDGALGFWKALDEGFPGTRHQRCWVHKTANVLNKVALSVQANMKKDLREIYLAPSRALAEVAIDVFAEKYQAKHHKAVECLTKDRQALLAFFDLPAEHWDHLRTTNPIESVFATVRHRTVRTKGSLSSTTARLMVFKLVIAASKTWRRLKGTNHLPKIVAGVRFKDGIEVLEAPANHAA